MRLGLAAFAILAFGILAACGSDTSDLEQRIAELEGRVSTLEESPRSVAVALAFHDDTTYPAGDCHGASTYTYRVVFGVASVEGAGYMCVEPESECAQQARVGFPLPDACSQVRR